MLKLTIQSSNHVTHKQKTKTVSLFSDHCCKGWDATANLMQSFRGYSGGVCNFIIRNSKTTISCMCNEIAEQKRKIERYKSLWLRCNNFAHIAVVVVVILYQSTAVKLQSTTCTRRKKLSSQTDRNWRGKGRVKGGKEEPKTTLN